MIKDEAQKVLWTKMFKYFVLVSVYLFKCFKFIICNMCADSLTYHLIWFLRLIYSWYLKLVVNRRFRYWKILGAVGKWTGIWLHRDPCRQPKWLLSIESLIPAMCYMNHNFPQNVLKMKETGSTIFPENFLKYKGD